jgi:hypothetical protein
MTDFDHHPFAAPCLPAMTGEVWVAAQWLYAFRLAVIIGERIAELLSAWSGDKRLGDEITALGWIYAHHRDRAAVLRQQLVDGGWEYFLSSGSRRPVRVLQQL